MQTLWSRYHEETEGHVVIEEAYGFIRFSIVPPVCLVHDLYVVPEERRKGYAWELADRTAKIARDAGCVEMWSEIGLKSKTCDGAMLANLAYGFKLRDTSGKFILMSKDIGGNSNG